MAEESHDGAPIDAWAAAQRLRELRAALLELLAELPETRLGRQLPRDGWTLRHDLSALVGTDVELPVVLDALRAAAGETASPPLRRVRGEAMHHAQLMRLSALRDTLAAGLEPAAAALAAADELLARPLQLDGRPMSD